MMDSFEPVEGSTASHLCAALVDLTGDPTTPAYAGLNDEEMVYAASLLKICVMYSAFALRARVQAFVDRSAAGGAPVTPPGVTSEIEQAWKAELKAFFPTYPEKSFANNRDILFPRLNRIFTFTPGGEVDFARAPLTIAQIDAIGEFGTPRGNFHDWMRSMLRWSNNAAASKCILELGYFYINGAIAHAELFDAGPPANGLWVSADYLGHDWVRTSAEKQSNAAGPALTPRWATAQGRQRSNLTATAAQVARFMTLLARDQLVDAAASQEMRGLMDVMHGGIGSYALDALNARDAQNADDRQSTSFASKIGYGDDSFSHDCAIVERTSEDGKPLRYVCVGLGSAPAHDREDLSALFVLLDEAIVTRND